ncbi:V-type proton ATPase subunit G [Parasteatoda tepidariorum]|uniref:V-type proton ATPase subunit G n=1 Tax=Parasteatoda tepidariorum TaxID=114398 RepID=A0A2L2Y8A3_PARTP|nr:V-type proton ATPase subunit G [Parasteatoda tepidariorum]
MFKNDSQSIQQLLVAEKRAEEKTNQARKRKNQRLKQAKEDALTEIGLFKEEKEKEFKEHEAKYLGSKDGVVKKIESDTEKSLQDMHKYVQLNKNTIIPYLLDQVFQINCELHANFRIGAF